MGLVFGARAAVEVSPRLGAWSEKGRGLRMTPGHRSQRPRGPRSAREAGGGPRS